jgi:hypothetical protein
VEDVQTVIIPFIDGVVEIEQAIVATSTNQTAKDESSKKIVQLTEAKNGWQSLLDRNLKLYQDARAGKLKTGVTHLVAEALLQDDNGVDNVKYINGSQAPNADALRAVSAIRFEGVMLFIIVISLLCQLVALVAKGPRLHTPKRSKARLKTHLARARQVTSKPELVLAVYYSLRLSVLLFLRKLDMRVPARCPAQAQAHLARRAPARSPLATLMKAITSTCRSDPAYSSMVILFVIVVMLSRSLWILFMAVSCSTQ